VSREEEELLCGGEVEVAGGADGWGGEGFAFFEPVGDFVADDGAEIGVGLLFLISVAAAAVVEVRAVADVAQILIGPADESVITVFWFHSGSLFC
jgi:hypothetical protein